MKCDVCPVAGPQCVGMICSNVCVLIASGRTDHRENALRLAGEPYTMPDPPATAKRPRSARIEQVNLCLYRECRTGCQKSKCWAKLRGVQWNDEPYTEVSMSECVACMGDTGTA